MSTRPLARGCLGIVLVAALVLGPTKGEADALPAGFQEVVAFSGLTHPTQIEFAADGRVFVAEKSGLIKVFDGLDDPTPNVFADLRTQVHNFWDRGLLGLALDPSFPTRPYVYALYTYDHELGSSSPPPRWGTPGTTSDGCPNPPGATLDGCVVSGRLSRLEAAGDTMTGTEQVLIEDWCQQYPSHSVGSLAFGADGALYVSGGEGAGFTFTDYGQRGSPPNPCGDPPADVGGAQTPPSTEGGALRSQDLRTPADPVTLDGAILRVDPDTGAARPDNPLALGSDANTRRIIATGLRNPFRITVRPGTNEVWLGDVGGGAWEEINRVPNPTDPTVENFGWPCYEGPARQTAYDALDLAVCENLYTETGGPPTSVGQDPFERIVPAGTSWGSAPVGGAWAARFTTTGSAYRVDGGLARIDKAATVTYGQTLAVIQVNVDVTARAAWSEPAAGNTLIPFVLLARYVNGANFYRAELRQTVGGALQLAIVKVVNSTTTVFGPATTIAPSYTPGSFWRMRFQVQGSTLRVRAWPDGTAEPTTWTRTITDTQLPSAGAVGIRASHLSGSTATPTISYDDLRVDAPTPTATAPFFAYPHAGTGTAGEDCPTGSSSITGLVFDSGAGGLYPSEYEGALFFADYSRGCIWAIPKGQNGLPDPSRISTFVAPAASPVDLEISPSGELFYADFNGGTIRRVRYSAGNQPPKALASATPSTGAAPLIVAFDGTGSSDPDPGDTLTYAWDLDGDSAFDDSSAAAPTYTYAETGTYAARLEVTDELGASSVSEPLTITVGNTPPSATIVTPSAGTTWRVGDAISFSGSGGDAEDGRLPPSALSWELVLHHCPSTCHAHSLQTFGETAGGVFDAPDHEYPSHLELRLTAVDSDGLEDTAVLRLDPRTVSLTLASSPAGLQLALNGASASAPFAASVIEGSRNSLSAPSPQNKSGSDFDFQAWSDGEAQSHDVVASAPQTYTAVFAQADTAPPETTIVDGPANPSTQGSASFGFAGSDNVDQAFLLQFECRLDGAAFAACSSPQGYSDLSVGSHTFEVRAIDRAGNVDPTPASYSWTVQAPCQGSTATVGAAADSWVLESSPSSNYGSDSVVKLDSKAGVNARSLFRFDLPAVPTSCQVVEARLRLYAGSYKDGRTLQALRLASAWTENAVTWNSQPATTGTAATTSSGSGYREWTVTSQVAAMYNGGNNGFLIRDAGENGGGIEQAFHSREKAPDNAPQLVITFGS